MGPNPQLNQKPPILNPNPRFKPNWATPDKTTITTTSNEAKEQQNYNILVQIQHLNQNPTLTKTLEQKEQGEGRRGAYPRGIQGEEDDGEQDGGVNPSQNPPKSTINAGRRKRSRKGEEKEVKNE